MTKCCFCISLRSAVYFGASIHIFLGVMLFSLFTIQTSQYLFLYYSGRPEEKTLTLISFLTLLLGALFLPLGCLIFRGVERESLSLIKWPSLGFFLTKLVEMSLKVYQVSSHPRKEADWESRLYHGIDLTFSSLYLIVLFFYMRKLARLLYLKNGDYFRSPAVNNLTLNSSKLLTNPEFDQ